jgi:hypothetical protein
MKQLRIAMAVAALCLTVPSTSSAVTTFPIRCRGGNGYQFNYQFSNYLNVPQFIVYFTRAPSPSSIGPGQCSWLDRPLNANEQPCFVIDNAKMGLWWIAIRPPNQTPTNQAGVSWAQTRILNTLTLSDPNVWMDINVYNPGPWECLKAP